MSKYHVYLADNYNRTEPFTTEWDYELLGDKLRAEFDTYYAEQQKLAGPGAKNTSNMFKGEVIKRFMISKRVNLVDNPVNGNLKSVFVLRKDEKKLIDGMARESLKRFEYKVKKTSDGTESDPAGFMKFDLIEGEPEQESVKVATLNIEGNDIEYFQEEEKPFEPEKVEQVEEVFTCEECGKSFDSKRALTAHSLSHRK